jgi:redox-sensitive bicupin YhaK (pirin superfamily)
MRRIERSDERGKSELGWLHSRFSYSFAEYLNPNRMAFGALRVVNNDTIEPGKGFPLHHHEQMEIVTIMLDGTLTHEDSMGNKSELAINEVQVMTAGTGVNHSEYNHSPTPVRLLQIWLYPKVRSLMPQYAQRRFDPMERNNKFQVLVSGIKKDDALFIHQDAAFLRGSIEKGATTPYVLSGRGSGVFVFVISGEIAIGEDILCVGDSIEITAEISLAIVARENADVLLIEVPMI